MARQEYNVILKDANDYEIVSRPVFGPLKEAKETAKYLASDSYADVAESTHADMGSARVEVVNEAGEIVWDMEINGQKLTEGDEARNCRRHGHVCSSFSPTESAACERAAGSNLTECGTSTIC